LSGQASSGSANNSAVSFSFWAQSPRSPDNLLINPNIPKLDLGVTSKDAFGFMNGKDVFSRKAPSDTSIAAGLPLQHGWNHFLVHLVHDHGYDIFSARRICYDPSFLNALHSALQEP
jgi:hypothetical protein